MTLVFQYGSNTCTGRLNSDTRLQGDAKDLGLVQTATSFELDFDVWSKTNNCAAADIREGSGRSIWGVLYEIPDYLIRRDTAGQRQSLDAIEANGTSYCRRLIHVQLPDGTPIPGEVITYTVRNPKPDLKTSIEYVTHIIKGLKEHSAPDEYVAYVKERIIVNNHDLATNVYQL